MSTPVWYARARRGTLTAFLTIVAATCSGSPTAPPPPKTGTVTATVQTSGSNQDPDGYTIALDSGTPKDVATNGTVTFTDVTVGSHDLTLGGVASNCMASPSAPVSVSVQASGTAASTFEVDCGVVMDGSGGTAATPDGKARVDVPSGALADTAIISVVPAPDSLLPSPAPGYVTGSAYQYRPDGTQFSKPVQVTLVYDPANVPSGASESSIRLHTVQNGQWVPVTGSSVDTTLHTVTGQTTHFSIYGAVAAQPGVLKTITATSGANLDPDGYRLVVDGGAGPHLTINDTADVTGLSVGDHTVRLDSVAANCTVADSNPRTVSVPSQDTASTTFTVSCSSLTGDLHVTTSTSGSNQDPDGYALSVDGGPTQHVAINDSLTLQGLAAGSHSVQLDSVAANCTVGGGATQTVTVPNGGTVTAAFSVSCSASVGDLKVKVPTTGPDPDPDGYTVTLDATLSQSVATGDSVTFTNIATGTHSVQLSGVAGNCSVSGSNPQSVSVAFNATTTATFDISCVSLTGDIKVRTQTGGTDLDPDGYTIMLDGGSGAPIPVNDSITYDSLAAGPHTIQLGNVASNCSVAGANPMTVDAPHGGVTDTAFVVSCAANVGDIQVTDTTTGSNLDASYTVTLDGTTSQALPRNSSVTFSNIAVGSHQITLSGVAENCGLQSSNPDTVAVTYNGTAQSSFSIGCVAPLSGKIAFESTRTGPFQVYLMNTDGTGQTPLTNTTTDERMPAISPDGNLIAIQSKRSGAWNIWVMLNDGSSPVSITNDGNAERHPVWSPDGTALAFDKQSSSGQHIYTINRDGTGLKLITDVNHTDWNPHWSPDGTKLVFVRDSLGNGEIYTIGSGGAGSPTNLTQDSAGNDFNPQYSPDGSQIVFASDRLGRHGDVYIMSSTGGTQTRLTTDSLPDFAPTYSPDGTYIYFTSDRSGTSQIWRMTASCVASIPTDAQACENTLVRITNDTSKDDNASMSP